MRGFCWCYHVCLCLDAPFVVDPGTTAVLKPKYLLQEYPVSVSSFAQAWSKEIWLETRSRKVAGFLFGFSALVALYKQMVVI